jgi:phenylalanyl-tRNA synthetase beta chain
MNILASYEWIREYLKIDADARAFANEMSTKSMSVERIDDVAARFAHMVVGEVLEVLPHPNADKLKIAVTDVGTAVNAGGESVEIVCGGVNLAVGQRVVVALPGARVRWHGEGDLITLGLAKIRGVESCGMICAPEEIGFEKAPCPPGGIWDVTDLVDASGGTPFADAFGLKETVFDLEVTTNRPDAMSIVGLAREAAAAVGGEFVAPNPPAIASGEGIDLKVSVQNTELCPRYMAVALDGVKVGPSPAWLQKKILLSGHRPINNIVDITNLVLHEYGQPMHAFDYDTLEGGEIVVREAKEGEEFIALDGNTYKLEASHLVIADGAKPVAVAGVMGGLGSGVSEKTTRVVFEAANFNEVSVRKTARGLNLYSDSQLLFEKGLSPQAPELALRRVVELALQVAGGHVASAVIDREAESYKPLTFAFDADRARSMIGMHLETKQMLGYLETLGFTIAPNGGESFSVTVPYWRDKDIEHDIDLVEEVARMYGYGNLPSQLPESAPPRKAVAHDLLVEDALKQLFKSAGYTEFYSNSLVSEDQLKRFDLDPSAAVQLHNALSSDMTHMRTSLIPSVLTGVEENQRRVESAKIFELSRVYTPRAGDLPVESTEIIVAQFGKVAARAAWLELKGVLEEIGRQYGVSFELERLSGDTKWHNTRSASVMLGGARVGELGQLAARYQDAFGIESPVFLLQLRLSTFVDQLQLQRVYVPVSELQAITRDLSVQLDREVPFAALEAAVKSASTLITQVALLDEYTGAPIPEGQKSVTLSLTIQPTESALTSEAIESILSTATKRLQTEFHATLR